MRVGAWLCLCAVSLGVASPGAHAESWSTYRDSVHGCHLEYPGNVFTREPFDVVENIQRFSGPDSDTYLRVMGADNDAGLSPSEVKTKYMKASIPGEVSYERTTGRFLVLSGFRGDSIFYTRVAVSINGRAVCIMEVNYPRQKKREFDAIVTRMSRSFASEG